MLSATRDLFICERDIIFVNGRQKGSSNSTAAREAQAGPGCTRRSAARKLFHAVERVRLARLPLQSHTARKARSVLPGELYSQGKKQYQVRSRARPASDSKAVEELRTHKVALCSMDRSGHRTIKPPDQAKSNLNWSENLSPSKSSVSASKCMRRRFSKHFQTSRMDRYASACYAKMRKLRESRRFIAESPVFPQC
jgi:hypothetical protein